MEAESTVAVVVPSPAMSLVLVATSRTICAPMFWTRSGSSISLATVTPSLVTVGGPNDFSSTTLRPLGPKLTATASESVLTPRRISSRAAWWNVISFAGMDRPPMGWGGGNVDRRADVSRATLVRRKVFDYQPRHGPSRSAARRRPGRARRQGHAERACSQARQPAGHARHEGLRYHQARRIARGFLRGRSEERGDLVHGRAAFPRFQALEGEAGPAAVHLRAARPGRSPRRHGGSGQQRQGAPPGQGAGRRLPADELRDARPRPPGPDEADQGGRLQGELRRASMDAGLAPGAAYQRLRSDRPRRYVPGRRRSAGKAQGEVLARAAR